ncbi:MAG: formylglycine-generating enzyme family protein [Gallionella sp.]|nr:formylglycine-generating enzyme family protein [Gallionella sp.]
MRNLTGFIIATCCLMWIPLQAQAAERGHASAAAPASKTAKTFRDCPSCPRMVVIPAGRFDMGSPDSEDGRADDEGPVHPIKIAAFAMSRTEITRGQFAAFAKNAKYRAGDECWTLEEGKVEAREGSWFELTYGQDDNDPIGCLSWNDAQAYTKWLSRMTGKKYRLPTEAEWEYAARGHTRTARYWGDNPDAACAYANGADQTAQEQIRGASSWSVHECTDGFAYTSPAGNLRANPFGLHDMLGNVWEWTEDSYHDSYTGAPRDGSAWRGDGAKRVLRGGSWNNSPRNMRSAVRNGYKPELRYSFFGFRIVRKLP